MLATIQKKIAEGAMPAMYSWRNIERSPTTGVSQKLIGVEFTFCWKPYWNGRATCTLLEYDLSNEEHEAIIACLKEFWAAKGMETWTF